MLERYIEHFIIKGKSVYERSITVFLFFFDSFDIRKRKSDIYEKYLFPAFFGATDGNFGEIQRHAIVITYMFVTNDRCEDTYL